MPIHDWTRVEAGDFHDFHQVWTIEIRNALNRGVLPPGYFAMAEQITGRPIPDVVALQSRRPAGASSGTGVKERPNARVVARFQKAEYSRRANRVIIRHGRGKVVAIIEIVSPGNKSSRNALRAFVEKTADILNQGINLLVVDLFPPTPRDPLGIHNAISEEFGEAPMEIPPGKPLTVVSYIGGDVPIAYLDPVAVGDALPSAAIFLDDDDYVYAPLEQTYSRAWEVVPDVVKELINSPAQK
jgi:hypothetical protein